MGNPVSDNWRVRRPLLNALPALAQARGKKAFEEQLVTGLVERFRDRTAEVRKSAVSILARLRDLPEDPSNEDGPRLFDGDWPCPTWARSSRAATAIWKSTCIGSRSCRPSSNCLMSS